MQKNHKSFVSLPILLASLYFFLFAWMVRSLLDMVLVPQFLTIRHTSR
uniref:Uncharacterized protein n=1 Tax=Arundo donax TaxID=35708 RepID=A0A0A9HDN6_ARUDO